LTRSVPQSIHHSGDPPERPAGARKPLGPTSAVAGGPLPGIAHNVALRGWLKRGRHLLAVLALVPIAAFMRPALLPAGFAVSLFGQAIQTWCLSSLTKNWELTVGGPYLVVRNPMYLGRYFLLLGFVLLTGNPWVVAGFTLLYYGYMHVRVVREERRLRRNFRESFERYCRDVRRFLPAWSRLADRRVWVFERELFFENHAPWNVVATLAAYAALYAYQRWNV